MKKCILVFSLLIAANFLQLNAYSFQTYNSYSSQLNLAIPRPVLITAEQWACDNSVLPETPWPDYVRAFYKQMSKTTWEVNWVWSKSGVQDEVRLLITKGGVLLDVY